MLTGGATAWPDIQRIKSGLSFLLVLIKGPVINYREEGGGGYKMIGGRQVKFYPCKKGSGKGCIHAEGGTTYVLGGESSSIWF